MSTWEQLDAEYRSLRHKADRIRESRDTARAPGLLKQIRVAQAEIALLKAEEQTKLRVPSEPRNSYFFESWIEQKSDEKGELNVKY